MVFSFPHVNTFLPFLTCSHFPALFQMFTFSCPCSHFLIIAYMSTCSWPFSHVHIFLPFLTCSHLPAISHMFTSTCHFSHINIFLPFLTCSHFPIIAYTSTCSCHFPECRCMSLPWHGWPWLRSHWSSNSVIIQWKASPAMAEAAICKGRKLIRNDTLYYKQKFKYRDTLWVIWLFWE